MIRFGSVCSGVEAASLAFNPLGWKAAWFSEIEPFPCALLAQRYPDVPNLGDMTTLPERIRAGEVEAPDVFCGGTPCFTGDHLVLTENGYLPIRDVKPGMRVVTHLGRLQKVLRTGSKVAEIGELKAIGHANPVRCTANHPFLTIAYKQWTTGSGKQHRSVSAPEWTAAKESAGRNWCSLMRYEIGAPEFDSAKLANKPALLMRLAGMYVGDGWIRRFAGQNKKAVMFGLNEKKLRIFNEVFGDIGQCVNRERTCFKVTVYDTRLADWLLKHFGEHAAEKKIPAWLMASKYRFPFLQGYSDTDGYSTRSGYGFSTVSPALAYGVADLCNCLGFTASVSKVTAFPVKEIEGRLVFQRDWYQVRAIDQCKSRKSRVLHGFLCRKVRSFETRGTETVFNLEVEEDNSYILEGAIVHNCQAFSFAGLRRSLDDARGNLSLTFCEIANELDTARTRLGQPATIIFWENVPGVLSTKDNAFGCFLGGLAGADSPLTTEAGRWPNAGYVTGPKRKVAWRVLDAQYFGVPQRRRRVYVVTSARDGFDPAKVLFECGGLSWDSETRACTEQAFAARLESGFGAYVPNRNAGVA